MATNLELHRDHENWKSDDAFWRDEVAVWHNELKDAETSVERLQRILHEHALKLEAHVGAIGFCEKAWETHEHQLAEAARARTPSTPQPKQEHYVETYDHMQHREAHEALKRKHHRLIAQIAMLMHALEKQG